MNHSVSKKTLICQFSSVFFPLQSLSLEKLLQQQLCNVAILFKETNKVSQCLPENFFDFHLKHYTGLVYRSAIAFPLARVFQLSPLEIAQQLVTLLREKGREYPYGTGQLEFMVVVASSGLIDFQLSDRSLAFWLQQLPSCQLEELPSISSNTHQWQQNRIQEINLFPFNMLTLAAALSSV